MATPPTAGFLSYAHNDEPMFKAFRVHLATLRRQFPTLHIWEDTDIHTGAVWEAEIMRRIAVAEVIILLGSAKFIASKFIYEKEKPAIEQRQKAGALVTPVMLRPCAFDLICDGKQATPTDKGKLLPISEWRPHNNGYNRAREQIATAIERHFGLTGGIKPP